MTFKFVHKIAVIHKMFPVLLNLLQGSDITCLGDGDGP